VSVCVCVCVLPTSTFAEAKGIKILVFVLPFSCRESLLWQYAFARASYASDVRNFRIRSIQKSRIHTHECELKAHTAKGSKANKKAGKIYKLLNYDET